MKSKNNIDFGFLTSNLRKNKTKIESIKNEEYQENMQGNKNYSFGKVAEIKPLTSSEEKKKENLNYNIIK